MTLMPDQSVTLPLHCAYCGGAVTLQLTGWPLTIRHDGRPVPDDEPELHKSIWQCPYCKRENEGGFPGRFAWVTKGHQENPPQ